MWLWHLLCLRLAVYGGQTIRYFFDFPKLELLETNKFFSVRWAPGHSFGNVEELGATGPRPRHHC
jgi:hypothetical protein